MNVIAYRQLTTDDIHYAMIKGQLKTDQPVMVRVFSTSRVNDVFDTIVGRYGSVSFDDIMKHIDVEGNGVILYMHRDESVPELMTKLKELGKGKSMEEMNKEQRDYGIGAQILRDIGVRKIKLLSRSKLKRIALPGYGLEITEVIEI